MTKSINLRDWQAWEFERTGAEHSGGVTDMTMCQRGW